METKEIKYGNLTIVVNRPNLTPEEQKKREEHIEMVLRQVGRSMERSKNEKD